MLYEVEASVILKPLKKNPSSEEQEFKNYMIIHVSMY